MEQTATPESEARSFTRRPTFFLIILGLIVLFLAAFLLLRTNGAGSTPNSPSTTKPVNAANPSK